VVGAVVLADAFKYAMQYKYICLFHHAVELQAYNVTLHEYYSTLTPSH
jgi:hypothetical protein